MNQTSTRLVFAAYAVVCLIFGTTFYAIKVGLDAGMPPFLSSGLRFSMAGVATFTLLGMRGAGVRLTWKDAGAVALVGIGMTGISFATLYWAEQWVSSGVIALLTATTPVFTTLIGVMRKKQRLDVWTIAGLAAGIAGCAMIVGTGSDFFSGDMRMTLIKLAAVGGELCLAIAVTYSASLTSRLPAVVVSGGQMLTGGVFLLVLSALFERHAHISVTPSGLAALAYLTIVGSMVGWGLYVWIVSRTNPTFASTWSYISPFIALFVGAAFLHEPLTPLSLAGGVVVIAGCLMLNRDLLRRATARQSLAEREAA